MHPAGPMCTGKRQTHIRNAPLPRTAVTGIDPYSRRREPWGQMLFSKIRLNLFHPRHLVDGEGTAAVAVAALQAVGGGLFERQIVLLRQHVAQPGQVVILQITDFIQTVHEAKADVLHRVLSADGGSKADHADLLVPMGQLPVFHNIHLINLLYACQGV